MTVKSARLLRCLAALAAVFALASTSPAGESAEKKAAAGEKGSAAAVVDLNAYYFGDPEHYAKPGAVDMMKVRDATPEFREIKRRRISTDRAEYWIYINKAYERIERALQRVARYKGYDLIGEIGFITGPDGKPLPVDDITDLVIRYLQ